MTNPIFAIPRTVYASYADLYRLIDLSGFEKVYIDELDPHSDNTYIVTIRNEESEPGWPGATADIRLYDLEWRRGPMANPPGVRETWYMDKWMAQVAGGRYIPVGSHPDLVDRWPAMERYLPDETYDVAFIGFITGLHRREVVRRQLIEQGLRVTPIVAWGKDRFQALTGSRCYLHTHQLVDCPGIPGLRMAVAAAYGLPVISEQFSDGGIFTASNVLTADYAHLAEFTAMWVRDPNSAARLADFARALNRLLTEEHTFRNVIEAAL